MRFLLLIVTESGQVIDLRGWSNLGGRFNLERFSGPDSSIECGEKDFSPIVSLLLSYGVWAEKLTRRSFSNPREIIASTGRFDPVCDRR